MATAKVKKVTDEKIIKLMQSDNYKDRFKAEYYQLRDQWEKLSEMLEKHKNGTLEFVPICPIAILSRQKRCMTEYLHILERRANIEKIKL